MKMKMTFRKLVMGFVILFVAGCAYMAYDAYKTGWRVQVAHLTDQEITEAAVEEATVIREKVGPLVLKDIDEDDSGQFMIAHPSDGDDVHLTFEINMSKWAMDQVDSNGNKKYDGIIFGHGTMKNNSFYFGDYEKTQFVEAGEVLDTLVEDYGCEKILVMTCNEENFPFTAPVADYSKGVLKVAKTCIKKFGIWDTDSMQVVISSDNFEGHIRETAGLKMETYPGDGSWW